MVLVIVGFLALAASGVLCGMAAHHHANAQLADVFRHDNLMTEDEHNRNICLALCVVFVLVAVGCFYGAYALNT